MYGDLGRSKVTLRSSLMDANHDIGVWIRGSDLKAEWTLVRGTGPDASGNLFWAGLGIYSDDEAGERASVDLRGCLISENDLLGMTVSGSDASIQGTVIRETHPEAVAEQHGIGVWVKPNLAGERALLTLHASVVENNRNIGVFVEGSDLSVEGTIVRGTLEDAVSGLFGRGLSIQYDFVTDQRASAIIRTSVVEKNRNQGVLVDASDATIEATVVRDTLPQAADQKFGRGVTVQDELSSLARGNLTVRSAVVENNHEAGIYVITSDAIVEDSVVRLTRAEGLTQAGGRGISVERSKVQGSTATIRRCLVEQNHDVGVYVADSDLVLEDSAVVGTLPREADQAFGDGVSAYSHLAATTATIQGCVISGSARAGASGFGADVSIGSSQFECNGINLDGEDVAGLDADVQDAGANVCGCEGEETACQLLSLGLGAPQPLGPAE